jgi:alpha-ketoglutaric semialdehyde dehydrogenase
MSANEPLRNAEPILIAGQWRNATATGSFRAIDPSTGLERPQSWPLSGWSDVDEALEAAVGAAAVLASLPGARIAAFLERYS